MIKGILSIIITVVSGVLVFIIGQILTHIWLNPLQQYKDLKKRIAYTLIYYANVYFSTEELDKTIYDDVSKNTRMIAAELSGFSQTLSWIHFGIPKKEKLLEASGSLIGLSSSFGKNAKPDSEPNVLVKEYIEDIENKLNLYPNRKKQKRIVPNASRKS